MRKIISISVSLFFIVFVFTLLILAFISSKTKVNLFYFPKLLFATINNPKPFSNFNLIFLGLDYRNDQVEKTQTTDTIMLFNLNTSSTVHLISLPRDLWDSLLEIKINKIYPQSVDMPHPYQFVENSFSRITGLPIDRTIILTTDNLAKLIDIIGGVDIYLESGFKDDKFPNPEYIKNPSPQTSIYKEVEFSKGWVHLNSSNINEFVRSRKSSDNAVLGGTDIGRVKHQQLVITALVEKLKSSKNYNTLINLYIFFHQDIQTNLTDSDIISILLAKKNKLLNLSLNKVTIPTNEDAIGIKDYILYYPGFSVNGQWVFLPKGDNYQVLHQFIQKSINYEN